MKIDAHNHPDWHKHDFDAFIKDMNERGIDKVWLQTWEAPLPDFLPNSASCFASMILDQNAVPVASSFSRCLEYKNRAPERIILGYCPNPKRPEALDLLKAAVDVYGVQVCGEVKFRNLYDDPDFMDIYQFCGDAGLPVTLHFDYPLATRTGLDYPRRNWWYGGSMDTLERMLQAFPNTKFLGHAPGFWGHISNDDLAFTQSYPQGPVIPGGKVETLLAQYPNLYCDMSAGSACIALNRDLEYTYQLINRFPDRFLYARDSFDDLQTELIESLNLSQEIKELIYHGNAERIVRQV